MKFYMILLFLFSFAMAIQNPCNYCKFCKQWHYCDLCPCETSASKPNCKYCHYCSYCNYCSLCSVCNDYTSSAIDKIGSILGSIGEKVQAALSVFKQVDEKRVENDIADVTEWFNKNNKRNEL